jgi:hypothetical protein
MCAIFWGRGLLRALLTVSRKSRNYFGNAIFSMAEFLAYKKPFILASNFAENRVARFFLAQHTKTAKNIPKRPQNIQNDHRVYQIL